MYLELYKVFDCVVRTKKLKKAALEMNFTPSSISYALTRLENKLGVKLLVRDKSGVILTNYGAHLLPIIRALLEMQTNIENEAKRLKGMSTGTIRLGTLLSASATWVLDIIKEFKNKVPLVDIKVCQGTYAELEKMLLNYEIDIAFVRLPVSKKLQTHFTILDPLICATPKDFVPINKTFITAADLQNKRFVIAKELFSYDISEYFDRNNVQYQLEHTISSDYINLIMVESGLGFSILPHMFLKRRISDVAIYPIKDGPIRKLSIATQDTQYTSSYTIEMLKLFKKYWSNEITKLHQQYAGLYEGL